MKKNDTTPPDWSELYRAAEAGYNLADARRQFVTSSRRSMHEFSIADKALRRTNFHKNHPAIYTCFDASRSEFAQFINTTRQHWSTEDHRDEREAPPIADKHTTGRAEKTIDDILCECARIEFDFDRLRSKQILNISFGWKEDLKHCRLDPDWSKNQGIFPGADTAPALAGIMNRMAASIAKTNPPQAAALHLASLAASHLREPANAYGRACCAEYEYNSSLADAPTNDDDNTPRANSSLP